MFLVFCFCQFLFSTAIPNLSDFRTSIINRLSFLEKKSQQPDHHPSKLHDHILKLRDWLNSVKDLSQELPKGLDTSEESLIDWLNKKNQQSDPLSIHLQKMQRIISEVALAMRIIRIEYLRLNASKKTEMPKLLGQAKSLESDLLAAPWFKRIPESNLPEFHRIWSQSIIAAQAHRADSQDDTFSDLMGNLAPFLVMGTGLALYGAYLFSKFCMSCWRSTQQEDGSFGTLNATALEIQSLVNYTTAALPLSVAHRGFQQLGVTSLQTLSGNWTQLSEALKAAILAPVSSTTCSAAVVTARNLLRGILTNVTSSYVTCFYMLMGSVLSGSCNSSATPPPAPQFLDVCTLGGPLAPGSMRAHFYRPFVTIEVQPPQARTTLPAVMPESTTFPTTTPAATLPGSTTSSAPGSTTLPATTPGSTPGSTTALTTTPAATLPGSTSTTPGSSTLPATTTPGQTTTTFPPPTTTALAPQNASRLYWAHFQNATIDSALITGPNVTAPQVLLKGNTTFSFNPLGLHMDIFNGRIYWTVYSANAGMYAADLDPFNPSALRNIKTLIQGGSGLAGIFVDPVHQKIYYSGYPVSIRVGSINTSMPSAPTNVIILNSLYTRSISVDVVNSRIYWTDWNTPDLWVGDINPQNPTTITNSRRLTTTGGSLAHMSIDFSRSAIYYRMGALANIYRAMLNLTAPTAPTNTTLIVTDDKNFMGNQGGLVVI